MTYHCSDDAQFRYNWGQPVVYNRAAFELVIPGLQNDGLVKQCLEYEVTHDVGNAIFHWMYSIPAVRFEFPISKVEPTKSVKILSHTTVQAHQRD
jgi:hypothetical protein